VIEVLSFCKGIFFLSLLRLLHLLPFFSLVRNCGKKQFSLSWEDLPCLRAAVGLCATWHFTGPSMKTTRECQEIKIHPLDTVSRLASCSIPAVLTVLQVNHN